MKKKFSTAWNSSRNVAKQRKYRFNAPLHIKQKFLSAHLSKDLKKKYGTRSVVLRTGDRVKVVRGQYRGRENKVDRVDLKKSKVYVTGVERMKKDGSKSLIPIPPSNLIITDLDLDDKKRKAKLERSPGDKKVEKKEPEAEVPQREKL